MDNCSSYLINDGVVQNTEGNQNAASYRSSLGLDFRLADRYFQSKYNLLGPALPFFCKVLEQQSKFVFAARSFMVIQKLCIFIQYALQGIHPLLKTILTCFTGFYWCFLCCHTDFTLFSFSETWRSLFIISLAVFSMRRADNFVKRFNDVPSAVMQLETINVQRKYFKLCLHPQATCRSCIIYHSL